MWLLATTDLGHFFDGRRQRVQNDDRVVQETRVEGRFVPFLIDSGQFLSVGHAQEAHDACDHLQTMIVVIKLYVPSATSSKECSQNNANYNLNIIYRK